MIQMLFSLILSAQAYIPPTSMILKRTSENAGAGVYAIEQELQMSLGSESYTWRETWLVENERTMKVTVTSNNNLWSLQYLYVGGQRWKMTPARRLDSQKSSDESIERWFHFRNPENFLQHMIQHKMVTKGEIDSAVRLARAVDVVNYAFGEPAPVDSNDLKPALWIEQDQFLVRKVRLNSRVEFSAENYAPYAKGLQFPKLRTVKWNGPTIQIRTISINSRTQVPASQFQSQSVDQATNFDGLQNPELKTVLEDFYSRLR